MESRKTASKILRWLHLLRITAFHRGTRSAARSSHVRPGGEASGTEMSYRLPVLFRHEARVILSVALRLSPRACVQPLQPRKTVTSRDPVSRSGKRQKFPASCAKSRFLGMPAKSSDNQLVVLLNVANDDAFEIAAFVFARLGRRSRFGLAGGSWSDGAG